MPWLRPDVRVTWEGAVARIREGTNGSTVSILWLSQSGVGLSHSFVGTRDTLYCELINAASVNSESWSTTKRNAVSQMNAIRHPSAALHC